MAEMAVSLVIDQLLPLLTDEAKLLRGVHKEFADIKDELESIQAFLRDADKRATATEGDSSSEGVKIWVKQVREASFRIEDIIDAYLIHVGQHPRDPGCVTLLHKIAHSLKTMIPRHQIAYEIQDIKSSVCGIKERSERYGFQRCFEQGSSNSRGTQNAKWHEHRMAALYHEDADVVGFEAQRDRLIDLLVKGRDERTVVSIVGMGGQGKTTLAKKVFDSKDAIEHFDCRVWITVSQSYDVEGLLRDLLIKLYKQKGKDPPNGVFQMDRGSLIEEVRNYLQQKRYVIMFDDVWSVHFWDEIEFAIIDNKNGSKIFITTRNLDVVLSCKKSSFIEVLELQPLTQEQSLELFNKKAFKFDYGGRCPKELIDITYEIVNKCKGLPLAIVAIGGLLCTKEKIVFEWQRFCENLRLELMKDKQLGIKEILGLSYDDLSYPLKSCLLYFGLYPEDYEVKSRRVIQQWIAEGFVKEERGKTLEEVAEGYLTELIHRSLVQVSSFRFDGKAKGCRVHDLIREMILEKSEDLNFSNGQSTVSGKIRRLAISNTSHDFIGRIESSHVRSLLVFENIVTGFAKRIPTEFRLLKVLDYESAPLCFDGESPPLLNENLGNLIHLKYLRLKKAHGEIPKSIGMLQNLETLDVRYTNVRELPKEISKLRKLRHLFGTELSLIQLKDGIGDMTSLQTLRNVKLCMHGASEVIKELGNLKQIRDLGLVFVGREDGSILSSSINEMQHLEKLFVKSNYIYSEYDVIDLNLISPPAKLRKLTLCGCLQKLPEWIPELQNLVELKLEFSYLTDDSMKSLKNMQNLLILSIYNQAYEGLCLHFEDGCLQKLKELSIEKLGELRDIIIDKGALPSLEKLQLKGLPRLGNIPTGIQHLEKLDLLHIRGVNFEFLQHNSTEERNWIMEHVPLVEIYSIDGKVIRNSKS